MDRNQGDFYEALKSRDTRFDGKFFTGVLTTGIYCRPICPAKTPRYENVRFYACAAAAESDGFRPCRRCRPDSAPGSPVWAGRSATVRRALRLICEGGLDESGVDSFASRLGVGDRHLRRLFHSEIGASPLAVALSQRLHLARQLLDTTSWPVSRIAHAAGFNSIRRFNDAFRRTFGGAPRRIRTGAAEGAREAGLQLRIPFSTPYDWDAMLKFLADRAVPGVEEVEDHAYRRTFRSDGTVGVIEVRCRVEESCLEIRLPAAITGSLQQIRERIRRLFDCEAQPAPIAAHLRRDRSLAPLLRARPGLRVPGAFDPFELAVRAVLGQQVSVAAARTLAGRLAERFGERSGDERLPRLFPPPERLARADLKSIGLPQARAATVRTLAEAVLSGAVRFDSGSPLDEFVTSLTRLRGIGPWTAHYIAMRAAGETDAFPPGDIGTVRAAEALGLPTSRAELDRRAAAWRPWRAYAVIYLWRSLEKCQRS